MKPAINKRYNQLKSNYSTPSIKLYFPKIPTKQSKTKQLMNKLKKESSIFIKKRRRRLKNKQMNNMLNPSSLNTTPMPKRTSKLNQRLVSSNIDHGNNLDAKSSTDIESDNSSTSSSYQSSKSSSHDESVNNIIKSNPFQCRRILFPDKFQPEDHSQSSSISISKINQYCLQTH